MKISTLFTAVALALSMMLAACTGGGVTLKNTAQPQIITTDDGKQILLKNAGVRLEFSYDAEGLCDYLSIRGGHFFYSITYSPCVMHFKNPSWKNDDMEINMELTLNEDGYATKIEYNKVWDKGFESGEEGIFSYYKKGNVSGVYEMQYNASGHLIEIKDEYAGTHAKEEEDEEYPYHGSKTATLTWESGDLKTIEFEWENVVEKVKDEAQVVNTTRRYDYSYGKEANKYMQFTFVYDTFFQTEFPFAEGLGFLGFLGKGTMDIPVASVYEKKAGYDKGDLTLKFYDIDLNEDGTIASEEYKVQGSWATNYWEYEYIPVDSIPSKIDNIVLYIDI